MGNNIQQKFIDNERAGLVNHLQTHFNNRQLVYTVVINESEADAGPVEKPLSTREQYLKLIEEYPLVKNWKDRLRLTRLTVAGAAPTWTIQMIKIKFWAPWTGWTLANAAE